MGIDFAAQQAECLSGGRESLGAWWQCLQNKIPGKLDYIQKRLQR